MRGVEFLVKLPETPFTPEDITEEQKMLRETAEKFMKEEVLPKSEDIEEMKEGLMPSLLKKAGELGIFAVEIPKEYEGLGLKKVDALLVGEVLAWQISFAVSCEGHITIGTYPILFFGTEEQKRKYLPDIAWARKISAYALTEPQAGSDALNSKTIAEDKGDLYILNGVKQFITNAGFADIFIVFAKVQGKDFSAFIVERDWGVQTGKEEKKMGQKGSSTRQLILENVKVPKSNLLYEVGKGHIVALNALNMGRMRLAGASTGSAQYVINLAINYAKERVQFKKPIIDFGLIRWKIANMLAEAYAGRSAVWRVTGLIDKLIEEGVEEWKAFEEYAIEAAILKVGNSEIFWKVADEAVQIHGGYGYIKDYEVERFYRDERVQRIYEGTNEINRLNIPEMIIRRVMKGRIDIMNWISNAKKDLENPEEIKKIGMAGDELYFLELSKRVLLQLTENFLRYGMEILGEEEILGAFSDVIIPIFIGESAIARANKHKNKYYEMLSQLYVQTQFPNIIENMRRIAVRVKDEKSLQIIRKLDELFPRKDVFDLARKISDFAQENGTVV